MSEREESTHGIGITHITGVDQTPRNAGSRRSLGPDLQAIRQQFQQFILGRDTPTNSGSCGVVECRSGSGSTSTSGRREGRSDRSRSHRVDLGLSVSLGSEGDDGFGWRDSDGRGTSRESVGRNVSLGLGFQERSP